MAQVVHGAPYPARTKTATGTVNGIPTEAEVSYFRDKILVLVSQGGKLAQWIQVPLSAPSAASVNAALPPTLRAASDGGATSLLPATHLTPRTLFGAGGEARETFGQLVAAQIGSLLSLRDAGDTRTLVLALGLDPRQSVGGSGSSGGRTDEQNGEVQAQAQAQAQAAYFDVVDLVQRAL